MAQPPLTTPENVRLLMGDNAPPAPAAGQPDTLLEHLISRASAMIRTETGRRFTSPVEADATRSFRAYAGGTIYLDEILSEADVLAVSDEYGPITSYEVRVESYPARGAYLYLSGEDWPGVKDFPESHLDWFTRNMRGGVNRTYWRGQRVSVRGNWGYAAIPEEIDYLTARTVSTWHQAEISHFAATFNEVQGTLVRPERLPAVVMSALKWWKVPQAIVAGVL